MFASIFDLDDVEISDSGDINSGVIDGTIKDVKTERYTSEVISSPVKVIDCKEG